MGHHINALVGSRRALAILSTRFDLPEPTHLTPSLLLLPLDEERLDRLATSTEAPIQGFTYLTPAIAAEIGRALVGEMALYIETDYFGGIGSQSAAFFEDDIIRWIASESNSNDAEQRSWLSRLFPALSKRAKSPISQGLERLGVVASPDNDEFDTVGLGRFRSLEALGIGDSD